MKKKILKIQCMEDFLFGNVKLNAMFKKHNDTLPGVGAKLCKTFKCVKLIFSSILSINQSKKNQNEENLKNYH